MEKETQHRSDSNFVSLFSEIASDAQDLLMREVALTKLELRYELQKAETAAISLGVGIGILAMGGMLLMLMVAHLMAALTVVPLWGCYGIVGGALALMGGATLAIGKTKTEKFDVVPQPTVERLKESEQWLTKQTTSAKR